MTRARLQRAPRAPLRAVLDTDVLVSYLLTHRPPIATLIDVHLAPEEVVLVTAPELLEELDRVLQYPRLQRYYSDEERMSFVALLMVLSDVIELPDPIPRICRDEDDDRVIACAVAGRADVIVSGDQDLLALGPISDIPVMSAADFLVRLERQEREDTRE